MRSCELCELVDEDDEKPTPPSRVLADDEPVATFRCPRGAVAVYFEDGETGGRGSAGYFARLKDETMEQQEDVILDATDERGAVLEARRYFGAALVPEIM